MFYVDFGRKLGQGSEPQLRLWIDKSFLTKEDDGWFVEFPIRNCDVIPMDNDKDLVVKPGESNLFYFFVEAGDGSDGKSVIDSIDTDQTYQFFEYVYEWKDFSTSTGILIFTKADKVKVRWYRTGYLEDDQLAEGTTLLYADGRREFIPNDKVVKYL
ncbi:MAG: hypothetical protein RXO36_04230 [Candidatus Nanopusillus acidilobi]